MLLPMAVFSASAGNLIKNGDFSQGLTGWTLRAANEGAVVEARSTGGVNNSPCLYVNKSQGAGDLIPSFTFEGAKAGDTYLISAKIKLAEAGKTATSKWARVVNKTGAFIDSTGVTVNSDEWTTVSVKYTLMFDNDSNVAGYSGVPYLRVSHGGTSYAGGYYIDDYTVVVGREGGFFSTDKRWEYDEEQLKEDTEEEPLDKFFTYDNTVANKLAQVMAFKTGSNVMFARANKIDLGDKVKPTRVNGTVMVPLRVLADYLTMMVEWDNMTETVRVYNAYYQLKCKSGSNVAEVFDFTTRESKNIRLSAMAQTMNGVLFFPADAFCNTFKKQLDISNDGLVLIGDNPINFTKEEKELACGFFKEELETINLYVSLEGNDENDGSEGKPVKSLEKVRDLAREYRDKNVIVNIAEGEYELDKILDFTNDDSKLGMARTIFRGHGDVIINGGAIARGWEEIGEINGVTGIYKHKLENPVDFTAIYEDGEMSVQARYPNLNYENISDSYLAVIQEPYTKTGKSNTGPRQSFLYDADIPELANPAGAFVRIWPGGESGAWRWHHNRHQIASIDTKAKKVKLATQTIYTLGTGSAYHIENDIGLLDAPGEFYVDKTEGYIYYYPRDKKNLENNIVLPIAGGVVRIKGSNENPVVGLEFENLSIRNSDGAAPFNCNGIRNIRLENCRVYSSGGHGVALTGYSQNNVVRGCEVFDIGHTAILVTNNTTYQHISLYNRVENNHVYNVGRIQRNGYGISASHAANTTIINNTVHDGPRFLITYSGGSDDGTIARNPDKIYAKNNLVAYNDLSNGMLESQDGGMLYNFRTWRNMNVSNRIHNSVSKNNSKTTHMVYEPLYNDDLTDYNINRLNLLDNNVQDDGEIYAAIRQKGAGGLVENNFVVASDMTQGVLGSDNTGDGRAHGSYFYNNIGYTTNTAPVYSRQISVDGVNNLLEADNNIFFNSENKYTIESGAVYTLDELREYKNLGLDKHSLTTNPMFVDYENNDFRLRYDSPAHELGTSDLSIRDMGVTSDFKFADKDEELKWMYVRFDGDTVDRSFRKLNIGQSISLNVSARTKTGFVADLSNAKIDYETDNKKVATVSADGVIKAVSNGIANITVTITKNGKTLSLPATVIVGDSVASVKIKNEASAIVRGNTEKLEHIALGKDGVVSEKAKITYTSSAPDVLEISSAGLMTGKKTGTSIITVQVDDGTSKVSAKKTFTVTDSELAEYNIFIENQKIKAGEAQPIEAWAVKENGRIVTLDKNNSSLTVSNPQIAKIENNALIGVGHGKVTVTLTVNYYGKIIKKSVEVYVVGADKNFDAYHVIEVSEDANDKKIAVYRSDAFNAIHNGSLDLRPNCLDGKGKIMGDKNTIIDDWWVKVPEWVSYEKTAGVDGSPCLKVNGVGGDADLYQRLSSLESSLVKGKKYIMTAKAKLIDGSGTGRFICVYRHGFSDQVGYWVTKTGIPLSADEWTEVTSIFEYNDQAGGVGYPDIALRIAGTASGYYLDDFGIYEFVE